MIARRCALLFVALAAVLPAHSAAASSYSTKIVVSLKFPAFHGTLQSAHGSCETGRTVKLFRERSGPDKLLGTDESDTKAKWSIPIGKRLTSGSYYARTAAEGRCRGAKSKVLSID